jgi:predicted nucleic acid-binding protein
MARHRRLGRVVVDTSVVIRAARAFRQQPPVPNTPELRLVLAWRDDPELFTWLYSQEILTEYREILRRLKVPRNAAGRFINLLAQGGEEITEPATGEFSPDPKDDPFYHCALGGDAD